VTRRLLGAARPGAVAAPERSSPARRGLLRDGGGPVQRLLPWLQAAWWPGCPG